MFFVYLLHTLFFLNLLRDIFYKYAMLFGGVSIDKVSGACIMLVICVCKCRDSSGIWLDVLAIITFELNLTAIL